VRVRRTASRSTRTDTLTLASHGHEHEHGHALEHAGPMDGASGVVGPWRVGANRRT
jgi:hypothetical protein